MTISMGSDKENVVGEYLEYQALQLKVMKKIFTLLCIYHKH